MKNKLNYYHKNSKIKNLKDMTRCKEKKVKKKLMKESWNL